MARIEGLWSSDFYQIGYITSDVDEAMHAFGQRLGIHDWFVIRDFELPVISGRTAIMNLAMAFRGPIQLELIQPLSGEDQVYRQALDGSSRFQIVHHHVAQRLPTLAAFESRRELVLASGFDLAVDGATPIGVHYCYADTRALLGHYSEFIYFSDEAFAALDPLIPRN